MPNLPRWAPGPLFVGLALLLGGYDGLHSDLAIQRALVAVRLWPHGWPDDLVMDHAGAHPGLLPDLLALAAQAFGSAALPGIELALYIGVLGVSGALLGALARALSRPALPLLLLCALPVALLGEGRLLHPALIARSLALPLWLGALLYLLRGDGPRAGLLAGLTLAVHPASGLGLTLGLLALMPRALPAVALGAAPLLPWALLGAEPSAPMALLRLRLGHHLDPRDWAAVGWITLAASVLAWRSGGGAAASPRLKRFFHLQLLFIALCAGGALAEVAPLARLHGAYAANGLWQGLSSVAAPLSPGRPAADPRPGGRSLGSRARGCAPVAHLEGRRRARRRRPLRRPLVGPARRGLRPPGARSRPPRRRATRLATGGRALSGHAAPALTTQEPHRSQRPGARPHQPRSPTPR